MESALPEAEEAVPLQTMLSLPTTSPLDKEASDDDYRQRSQMSLRRASSMEHLEYSSSKAPGNRLMSSSSGNPPSP